MIYESPNKQNMSYSVFYMSRDESLETYFEWLVKELVEQGIHATRTIVYCQTIKQCTLLYATLKGMLGKSIYTGQIGDGKRVLVEMLHSCTPAANKEAILHAFKEDNTDLRVLIATIAFGMGVDCRGVCRVVHFGPSKNVESYIQETGRGGRDGNQSVAYIIYQGLLLNHVEKDIKSYVKSGECRRKTLMGQFDNCQEVNCPEPQHLCCDNCEKNCKCENDDCGKLIIFPGSVEPEKEESVTHCPTRATSEEQTEVVSSRLSSYHRTLVHDLISKSPSGQVPTLTNLQFMLGFSDQQITQVLENCDKIFTLEDVMSYVEVWHEHHAYKIMEIISSVFADCEPTEHGTLDKNADSDEEEEESDTWLGDWERLVDDEELFELAVENLSLSSLNASMNDTLDNTMDSENLPVAAVSALENLKLF